MSETAMDGICGRFPRPRCWDNDNVLRLPSVPVQRSRMLRRILHPSRAVQGLTARLLRRPAPVVVRFYHTLLPAMVLVQYGLVKLGYLVQELRSRTSGCKSLGRQVTVFPPTCIYPTGAVMFAILGKEDHRKSLN